MIIVCIIITVYVLLDMLDMSILDKKIDSDFKGVPTHLGKIAKSMDKWEGMIADALKLTKADVEGIKLKHPSDLELQS